MTLTTRINILNLDTEDTSAMDLWKVIAEFAGFPFDTCSPNIEKEEYEYITIRSPLGVEARAWVSVTTRLDGCAPVTALLYTVYGEDYEACHIDIVNKLIAHLHAIDPGIIVLAQNEYTSRWKANAAPY